MCRLTRPSSVPPENATTEMPLHHSWHGPKHATPPLDFLEAIESRFELALFTLNKDDGR